MIRFLKKHLLRRELPRHAWLAVAALVMLASVVTGREKPSPAPVAEPAARLDTRVEVVEDIDLGKLAVREPGQEKTAPAEDPFARRSFSSQQKEIKEEKQKPVAPALPFRYVGKMIEDGKLSVFVSRGDDNFSLQAGQTIGGEYRVEQVSESSVVFTFLPLKTRQELQIPAVN